MRSYRLSHPARADLDAIWLHIAQNAGVDTADRFIDTLTNRLPMLAEMPEAGRSADEIEPGVRVFPIENYLIYYRISPGWISIARVIHGRRDQETAWRKESKEPILPEFRVSRLRFGRATSCSESQGRVVDVLRKGVLLYDADKR